MQQGSSIRYVLLAAMLLAPGCSTAPKDPGPAGSDGRSAAARGRRADPEGGSPAIPREKGPSWAGRVLVYPLNWTDAEEAAATLRTILEAQYGPGLRIVPNRANNALLIYFPPEDPRRQKGR